MKIFINKRFRYVHEPLKSDETAIPFISHQQFVDRLKERILRSTGGCFLVTGFRGVGKTTVVNRTIGEIIKSPPRNEIIIPVYISVARPMTTQQLLFEIIRRLFEYLVDCNLLQKFHPNVAYAMTLAYARTSVSFKRSQSKSYEKSLSAGLEESSFQPLASLVKNILPKISFSKKSVNSLATEAAFLAYTETDVEHDFLRINEFLKEGLLQNRSIVKRLSLLFKKKNRFLSPVRPRLVVVIDELDKLTLGNEGLQSIDSLFASFKNILTTSGVCFIFIGGLDLHDKWIKDLGGGNSLYESIFAWHVYVSCVWGGSVSLLEDLLQTKTDLQYDETKLFSDYMEFKGRGIPRRFIQEFNSFVKWDNEQPYIEFDALTKDRINFYGHLQQILSKSANDNEFAPYQNSLTNQDRRKVACYYVVDWVLRTQGEPFSVRDILSQTQTQIIDPNFLLNEQQVITVLQYLCDNDVIFEVGEKRRTQTIIEDVPASRERVFSLKKDVWERLSSIAQKSEQERKELKLTGMKSKTSILLDKVVSGKENKSLRDNLRERYQIQEAIGQGGMGSVYKAYDRLLGRHVALKVLRWRDEKNALQRFMREAQIASSLSHPNIIRTFDVIEQDELSLIIVMELINGRNLSEIIMEGKLSSEHSVALVIQICEALIEIHSKGIVRIDLKPSNIMVEISGRPVIIDLGLARFLEEKSDQTDITRTGAIIGTPAYMAPEQISDDVIDNRIDLFSLGVVFFELISGHRPWDAPNVAALFQKILQDQIDVSKLEASEQVKKVILKVTNKRPQKRFKTAQEFLDAIKKTPEAATKVDLKQILYRNETEFISTLPSLPKNLIETKAL